jgi:CzcA family heavy metal efflux pump
MLTAILRFSLRFQGAVIAIACVLAGYALYTLFHTNYDVFPEFAPPQVNIQTEAPGLAPEQVEVLVTQPIENALNGVAGIDRMSSSSIQGLSVVTVTFQPGSNIYRDRQVAAERLVSLSGELPQGVQAPLMTPLTSSTGDVMTIGLTSTRRSLMELRTIADWVVVQRLLAVPGVAKASVFGGDVRQLQIQIRPDRLIQYRLGIEEIVAAAQRATGVRGAGFIDNDNQRIVIRAEGQSLTAGQLAETVLAHHNGASVTLGDVARVIEAPAPPISAAGVMGQSGVIVNVWAQYGANTVETDRMIQQALDELRPVLSAQEVVLHPDLFRAANFIQAAIGNVMSSLLIGSALVVIVLFLFLLDLRTTAISCAAIPLSLLGAVAAMEYLGLTLNTMTLGGLAIAVGLLVDDAVITVENIFRRMREHRQTGDPRSIVRVVLDATLEVRNAVVYATIAVALVFIPVMTMSGLAGRLFAPLAVAYIMATLTSLLVALTVTPALCAFFLSHRTLPEGESPVVRWLKTRYRTLLGVVEQHARTVLGAVLLLTIAGLSTIFFFGVGFLPDLREGHFIVHMSAVPGTSLHESLRLGRRISLELFKLPFVRTVGQRVGRASADDTFGPHSSEFEVDLKPLSGDQAESAESRIRQTLAQFPGVNFAVNTFLTERIEETLTGYTASVVVNVFGTDLDRLDRNARDVAAILGRIPGAQDVTVQSPPGAPQLAVRLRAADLTRWGFDAVDVLEAIRTAFQGLVVGQVYEGNRVFDVSVILDESRRRTLADVGDLLLRNPEGRYLRLRQVADLYETAGRYVVLHEGARRVQTITCNVVGDINTFVHDAKRQITAAVTLPPNSYIEFSGTAQAQARSTRDLTVHSLVAAVGIILLLSIVMGNARALILVLANLPFALVGGVLAVFASGGSLSLGSLVGFVTLFGITLRNSVMMISHYGHLVSTEGVTWGSEAAIRGASERLVPILMTALVTSLGLLPLAIGSGAPGREIEGPMALVILGGLVTSTLLNLLVLPTLALHYGRFEQRKDELPQA